jgi:hypothetical protein
MKDNKDTAVGCSEDKQFLKLLRYRGKKYNEMYFFREHSSFVKKKYGCSFVHMF